MTGTVARMSSAPVHAPVRPVHDRPTLVSYASLATWSWFVYAFGASLALLRDDQGTSAWLGGLHSTALAAGAVGADAGLSQAVSAAAATRTRAAAPRNGVG